MKTLITFFAVLFSAIQVAGQGNPVDIAITAIPYPSDGCLTVGEPVIVTIQNVGLNPVDNFDITFKLMNSPLVVENWSLMVGFPINPGQSMQYAFIPVVDLSAPGTYNLKAWVSNCLGDINQMNDTLVKSILNPCFPALACTPGSVQEAEICGAAANNGCFAPVPGFENINPGVNYCGTSIKQGNTNDPDWYRFSLNDSTKIRVICESSFLMKFRLYRLPCPNPVLVMQNTINRYVTDTLTVNTLPPGVYSLVFEIDPGEVDRGCNDPNTYRFRLDTLPNYGSIQGHITYDNTQQTPLSGPTWVTLTSVTYPGLMLTDTVDINGFYSFTQLLDGSYQVQAGSQLPWGGANAADAIMVLHHFTGQVNLTGLSLMAANVNANGFVNALAALNIMRRFVNLINSFPAGDWVFETGNVQVTGQNQVIHNLKGRCTGDVNGSYVP